MSNDHADTIRYACKHAMIGIYGQQQAVAALDALLAERQQAIDALGEAAVVLEVLTAQIKTKPYAEMTGNFQGEIMRATAAVRAALVKLGEKL